MTFNVCQASRDGYFVFTLVTYQFTPAAVTSLTLPTHYTPTPVKFFILSMTAVLTCVQAYPNWEWHADAASGDLLTSPAPNCSNLVSVFRVRADRCNRLWVLDSGVMDSIETFSTVCPPKLLVFDMRSDRMVSTYPKIRLGVFWKRSFKQPGY